jgi:hypothetical protein
MTHVSLEEVKQWFNNTKLDVDFAVPVELEATTSTYVLGRLQDTYVTTGWNDAWSTPPLVRKIISMFIAAWHYEVTYSDDQDLSTFGRLLKQEAEKWLEGVVSGKYDLGTQFPPNDAGVFMSDADFWPNNTTYGPVFLMDPAEQPF